MLEIARERVPAAAFVPGDALPLPFADDTFERVFTGHFYGHLAGRARAHSWPRHARRARAGRRRLGRPARPRARGVAEADPQRRLARSRSTSATSTATGWPPSRRRKRAPASDWFVWSRTGAAKAIGAREPLASSAGMGRLSRAGGSCRRARWAPRCSSPPRRSRPVPSGSARLPPCPPARTSSARCPTTTQIHVTVTLQSQDPRDWRRSRRGLDPGLAAVPRLHHAGGVRAAVRRDAGRRCRRSRPRSSPRAHAGRGQRQLAVDPGDRYRRALSAGVLDVVLARRARQRHERDRQPAGALARLGDRRRRPGRARADTLSAAKPLLIRAHNADRARARGQAPRRHRRAPAVRRREPEGRGRGRVHRRPDRRRVRVVRAVPVRRYEPTRARARPSRSSSSSPTTQRHPAFEPCYGRQRRRSRTSRSTTAPAPARVRARPRSTSRT